MMQSYKRQTNSGTDIRKA